MRKTKRIKPPPEEFRQKIAIYDDNEAPPPKCTGEEIKKAMAHSFADTYRDELSNNQIKEILT